MGNLFSRWNDERKMNNAIRSMFGGSTKSAMATILSFSMEDKAVLCAIETSRRYVDSAARDPSTEMAVVISNAQEEERFLVLHENLWVYSGGIGRSPKA